MGPWYLLDFKALVGERGASSFLVRPFNLQTREPLFLKDDALVIEVHVLVAERASDGTRVGPTVASGETMVGGVGRIVDKLVLHLSATGLSLKLVATCCLDAIHFLVTRSIVHERRPRWHLLLIHEKCVVIKPLLHCLILSPRVAHRP